MAARPFFFALFALISWLMGHWVGASEPAPDRRQVQVWVKFVVTSEETGGNFRALLDLDDMHKDGPRVPPTTHAPDKKIGPLMGLLRNDSSTKVLLCPNMVAVNKRPATFLSGAEGLDNPLTNGFRVSVLPQITADGKTIKMPTHVEMAMPGMEQVAKKMKVKSADGEEEQEVEVIGMEEKVQRALLKETLTLPKDQTVVAYLGKMLTETVVVDETPILSRIPYVNRFFRNVGYGRETQEVFVFINARVVEGK